MAPEAAPADHLSCQGLLGHSEIIANLLCQGDELVILESLILRRSGPLSWMEERARVGSRDVPGAPRPDAVATRRVTFAELFEEFLAFSKVRGRSPTTLHGYAA